MCLLGFAATDFIITITLSAADATAHIVENPFVPAFVRRPVGLTIFVIASLGTIFLRGFSEAIGLAVLLVGVYLFLNVVVVCVGLYELMTHLTLLTDWRIALFRTHGSPFLMIGAALLLFSQVGVGTIKISDRGRGNAIDSWGCDGYRGAACRTIAANARKLLLTAAVIMSVLLITAPPGDNPPHPG